MPRPYRRPLQRDWRIDAGDHAAAYRARREFADELRKVRWQNADYASAELIFGELVHNAVRHARSLVQVELIIDASPRLLVRDDGPGFWFREPTLAPPEAERGRGLGIVRAVARGMHFERRGDASVVTVQLPLWLHCACKDVDFRGQPDALRG